MVDWLVYLLAFYIGCNHSANHQWRTMQHQQAKEILDRLKRLEDAVERLEDAVEWSDWKARRPTEST